LNLAIFVLDPDATKFKTFSLDIIYSEGIREHLQEFKKEISRME
jgi:hypothetical protein